MVKRPRHCRADGFTLLEVLIALAMLAIALTAVARGVGVASKQAGELAERHLAQWVAQDRMAEAHLMTPFPDIGEASGESQQGGYKFRWQKNIRSLENPLIRRVDIRIQSQDGRQLASLTSIAMRP